MSVIAIVLTVTATILIFVVQSITQSSPPFDPFAPYADLLNKGQTLESLASRKFSCEFALLEASQKCSLIPEDGNFSKIIVTINEGVPNDISFQVNEDMLMVGDLVVVWGQPEKQKTRAILSWSEDITARAVVHHELNYLGPVQVVSFTF